MTTGIKKYKKKPVQVEAVQVPNLDNADADDVAEIIDWGGGRIFYDDETYPGSGPILGIETHSGHHYACPGDWIIKGIDGTFYATTNDTFQQLYEAADAGTTNGTITW